MDRLEDEEEFEQEFSDEEEEEEGDSDDDSVDDVEHLSLKSRSLHVYILYTYLASMMSFVSLNAFS